ncbi:hypothetical protein BDR06DRAFT_1006450 [Suillus hirtellus]|nr:hypothetical protein BDR06DRAFT_1006450 [Suillus hirtellus]
MARAYEQSRTSHVKRSSEQERDLDGMSSAIHWNEYTRRLSTLSMRYDAYSYTPARHRLLHILFMCLHQIHHELFIDTSSPFLYDRISRGIPRGGGHSTSYTSSIIDIHHESPITSLSICNSPPSFRPLESTSFAFDAGYLMMALPNLNQQLLDPWIMHMGYPFSM